MIFPVFSDLKLLIYFNRVINQFTFVFPSNGLHLPKTKYHEMSPDLSGRIPCRCKSRLKQCIDYEIFRNKIENLHT